MNEFLDLAKPEITIELTPLNPASGEPAISNIPGSFARGSHAVTANKGPIAHAYTGAQGRSGSGRHLVSLRVYGDGWRAGI